MYDFITVNAWDKAVLFNPSNCTGSGWEVYTWKGASGAYRSCSNGETTPSARISFTGLAVYYVSTFFNNQSVIFRLDGVPSLPVSLAPPPNISSSSNATKVMWSMEGLVNRPHTLELFPGTNESTLTFDTVVYASSEMSETSSSSSFLSTTSPSSSGTTSASQTTTSIDTHTVAIIFGSIIGSLSGLILLGLTIMLCRRRRQLNAMRYYHSSTGQVTVPSRAQDFGNSKQETIPTTTQNSHMMRFSDDLPSSSTAPHIIRPLPTIPSGSSPQPLARSPVSHINDLDEDSQGFRSSAYATSHDPLHASDSGQQYNELHRGIPLISNGARVMSPSSSGTHVKLEPLRKPSIRGDKA